MSHLDRKLIKAKAQAKDVAPKLFRARADGPSRCGRRSQSRFGRLAHVDEVALRRRDVLLPGGRKRVALSVHSPSLCTAFDHASRIGAMRLAHSWMRLALFSRFAFTKWFSKNT